MTAAIFVSASLLAFFALLLLHVARNPQMFLGRYGRYHRICGGALLAWLCVGAADAAGVRSLAGNYLAYDLILGALGTLTTLTAAFEIGKNHKRVKQNASGTLEEAATVTQSEMLEHAFYQLLNVAQIGFLHALPLLPEGAPRLAAAMAVVAVWTARPLFPVNSFSANYATKATAYTLIGALYRLKKYQYLLYKHLLLHGLNASLAADVSLFASSTAASTSLAATPEWRLYWTCLNIAYVHEFFLQTLVKRGYMRQPMMLGLNQLLMAVSTYAALRVLPSVHPALAALSLALNLARRGREVSNGAVVLGAAAALRALDT